ncbi:hypothetical protein V3481_008266 [Fusarium oxysporum f. sp. vasinfectum]|jgi:hypothetical protein
MHKSLSRVANSSQIRLGYLTAQYDDQLATLTERESGVWRSHGQLLNPHRSLRAQPTPVNSQNTVGLGVALESITSTVVDISICISVCASAMFRGQGLKV